jgi:hypothetical protein
MFYELFIQSAFPFNIELLHGCPLYRPASRSISALLSGKYNENNFTKRFRLKYVYNACQAGRWLHALMQRQMNSELAATGPPPLP